jgi:nicotinamide riboside transporter PnuC
MLPSPALAWHTTAVAVAATAAMICSVSGVLCVGGRDRRNISGMQ